MPLTHSCTPDPAIFRAYDIRGIYGQSLTEAHSYAIGRAAATYLLNKIKEQQPQKSDLKKGTAAATITPTMLAEFPAKIVVGRDCRLSGPQLHQALIEGILSMGVDVIDIGAVTTPVLYFAAAYWNIHSGIMITGSHNPADYNGFKLTLAGEPLAKESIQKLYQYICADSKQADDSAVSASDTVVTPGHLSRQTIEEDYLNAICNNTHLAKRGSQHSAKKKLKIVVDAGNGIAGPVSKKLLQRLDCDYIDLYCEPDGRFPHHHPDPGKPENLVALVAAIKEHQADVGLAFDGDGDRLGIVTNQGKMVFPDYLLMLFARQVLKEHPGSAIIFDVKCTHLLVQEITRWGGRPSFHPTGHSLIKKHMKKTGAMLAGEMSGHIFFADRWYGFDDALYAAVRLLEILSVNHAESLSSLLAQLPAMISTPEINISLTEEEKFAVMRKLAEDVVLNQAGETIKIDGIRVNTAYGWGLVRASNTTPVLVLRFEAENQAKLAEIKQLFKDALLRAKADIHITF